jgi:hypothetical protein
MVCEDPVLDDDDWALQEEHRCGHGYADVEIVAEGGFVRGEVLLDRIKGCESKGLV